MAPKPLPPFANWVSIGWSSVSLETLSMTIVKRFWLLVPIVWSRNPFVCRSWMLSWSISMEKDSNQIHPLISWYVTLSHIPSSLSLLSPYPLLCLSFFAFPTNPSWSMPCHAMPSPAMPSPDMPCRYYYDSWKEVMETLLARSVSFKKKHPCKSKTGRVNRKMTRLVDRRCARLTRMYRISWKLPN